MQQASDRCAGPGMGGDSGAATEALSLLVIIPILIITLLFSVQVHAYRQAEAALYSSTYMALRAAETYYAGVLTNPAFSGDAGHIRLILDENLAGHGLDPSRATMSITQGGEEFPIITTTYEVPVIYLSGPQFSFWGDSLTARAELMGRRAVR